MPSEKVNWVFYLTFPFYITNPKKIKFFEKVSEFRQQTRHWNVLIVLGYWYLLQSSFLINLNLFYVKIGEPHTKTKLSTVSRQLSSFKCFPWSSFESKDSFCFTKVKIFDFFSWFFLGATLKSQKCSKTEALLEIWQVPRHTRIELHVQRWTGRVLHSLPKWYILKSLKFLANNLDTLNLDILCINDYFFICICIWIKMQHVRLVNWHTRPYLAC